MLNLMSINGFDTSSIIMSFFIFFDENEGECPLLNVCNSPPLVDDLT
jgi:hypothetical protein